MENNKTQQEYLVIPKRDYLSALSDLDNIKKVIHQELLKKWVSKQEAAKILGVSSKTLEGYFFKGVIGYSQYRAKIYVKTEDIEEHLNRHYTPKK